MYELSIPSVIKFGESIVEEIGSLVRGYGSRVLLVTDYSESDERGILSPVETKLQESCHGVILYNRLLPLMSAVEEVESINWAAQQASKARCDVVVGLGRHETLHAAKAIAYLLSNGGNIEDYFLGRQGNNKTVAYVEVPTGFGFIPGLVPYFYVTDQYNNSKKIIEGSKNYADLVVVDPKLSYGMTLEQSTSMGLELLALAIDSLTSKRVTPFAEALGLRCVEIVLQSLSKSVRDQESMSLKIQLSHASVLGSLAVGQSSPGVVFALSLAIRSVCRVLVSQSAPVLLPYVMEFNATAAGSSYYKIARLQDDFSSSATIMEASLHAIESIRNLLMDLDYPVKLSQIQLDTSSIANVIHMATSYHFMHYAPWLFAKDDLHNLLASAL